MTNLNTLTEDIIATLKPLDAVAEGDRESYIAVVDKKFLNALTPKHTKLGALLAEIKWTHVGADVPESEWPAEMGAAELLGKKCEATSVKWAIYTLLAKSEQGDEDVSGALKVLKDNHFADEYVKKFVGEKLVQEVDLLVDSGTLYAEEAARGQKRKQKHEAAAPTATAAADGSGETAGGSARPRQRPPACARGRGSRGRRGRARG